MRTKYKIIISVVALTASYGAGRWGAPAKVVTQGKTAEVEKKQEQVKNEANKNMHTVTKTKEIDKPDGTKEKDTVVTQDVVDTNNYVDNTQTKVDETKTNTTGVSDETQRVTEAARASVNVLPP